MARSITVIPVSENLTRVAGQIQLTKKKMAAYCRVSTDQEEQLLSYENQVNYYSNYIQSSPEYEFAGVYADEGISATNTKKRDDFKRMIKDCHDRKIDMIITKSISRFARNTLDCLNYVRELKELGVGIIFEKENINTLDAKGEVLLTILSSLAQDESRSISENSTWGIRRRYEQGQFKMSTKRFLGYDTDEEGNLVINKQQAKIVVRIYEEYLNGKTVEYIAREFTREGITTWNGKNEWHPTTLQSMLENEKYKGDVILQKSYTVDFLSKKRVRNEGEVLKYCVEENHEAITDVETWECVQLEMQRRRNYMDEHGINSYSHNTENNPFASKIICGNCNKVFTRKGWKSKDKIRKVWQCSGRYREKGVKGCTNRHVDEETLEKAYVMALNEIIENKDYFIEKWKQQINDGGDLLMCYRSMQLIAMMEIKELTDEFNTDFMLKILDHIKVFDDGTLMVKIMDSSVIECKCE